MADVISLGDPVLEAGVGAATFPPLNISVWYPGAEVTPSEDEQNVTSSQTTTRTYPGEGGKATVGAAGAGTQARIVLEGPWDLVLLDSFTDAPPAGVLGSILIQDDVDSWTKFVDLVNDPIHGLNWVRSVEWGEDVESPSRDAQVTLFRTEEATASMSPLMRESAFNLKDGEGDPLVVPGKLFRIQHPVEGITHLLLDGVVDRVDPGKEEGMLVEVRGMSGEVLSRQVEESREYGAPVPGPGPTEGGEMGGVFQTILLDWFTPPNPDISPLFNPYAILYGEDGDFSEPYPESSETNAYLGLFNLAKGSLLEELKKIAEQIGWDLRFWKAPTNEPYRLTLFKVPRDRVDEVKAGTREPDFVADPGLYTGWTSFAISRETVKNRVKVVFTDASTGLVDAIQVEDPISQKKYGIQYMELDFTDSFIDSLDEAVDLGVAAINDLAEPGVVGALEMPFKWDTGLYQVWEFPPDGEIFSETQYLAVSGYRHSVSVDGDQTTVQFTGKPVGSIGGWLRKAGPGPEVDPGGASGTVGGALAYPVTLLEPGECVLGGLDPAFRFSWSVSGDPDAVGFHAVVTLYENGVVDQVMDPAPLAGDADWSLDLGNDYTILTGEQTPLAGRERYTYQGRVDIIRDSDGALVSSSISEIREFWSVPCDEDEGF